MFFKTDCLILLVPAHHDGPAWAALAEIVLHLADLVGPGPHHGPEETGGSVSLDAVLQQSFIKSEMRSAESELGKLVPC